MNIAFRGDILDLFGGEVMSKYTCKKANNFIAEKSQSVNADYKGDYHFSAPVGWINDPNGFVYYKGKYHLFYQYHPYSAEWGPMHWGHAVSEDLIKWTALPVALSPDKFYDKQGCWSGGAVVLGERLYLMYTGVNALGIKAQCLAYSDNGVDFIKYGKNPVIKSNLIKDKNEPRDPYVWAKNGRFYCLTAAVGGVKMYYSGDLVNWGYLGADNTLCKNVFECPCLINCSGKDVLIGSPVRYPLKGDEFTNYSSNIYSVGKLDYKSGKFLSDGIHELDRGTSFYAAQCAKGENGKLFMIAWMNMWERKNITAELSHGWSGMMTLPREIEIINGRLIQRPVKAIEKYYKNEIAVSEIFNGEKSFSGVSGRTLALNLNCNMKNASRFSVRLFNDGENYVEISYDKGEEKLIFDASRTFYSTRKNQAEKAVRTVSYALQNNRLQLQVFADKSSVEAFTSDGEITASMLCFNKPEADGITFCSDGEVSLNIIKHDIG